MCIRDSHYGFHSMFSILIALSTLTGIGFIGLAKRGLLLKTLGDCSASNSLPVEDEPQCRSRPWSVVRCTWTVRSVSYTHLDVYKRQSLSRVRLPGLPVALPEVGSEVLPPPVKLDAKSKIPIVETTAHTSPCCWSPARNCSKLSLPSRNLDKLPCY